MLELGFSILVLRNLEASVKQNGRSKITNDALSCEVEHWDSKVSLYAFCPVGGQEPALSVMNASLAHQPLC